LVLPVKLSVPPAPLGTVQFELLPAEFPDPQLPLGVEQIVCDPPEAGVAWSVPEVKLSPVKQTFRVLVATQLIAALML